MREHAEWFAGALALVVGGPLVYMFASAVADGQSRAEEAPFRAILGEEVFERLADGEDLAMHYMGDDRTAPDFSLPDRNGRRWRLSDHRGKVIVMNFWSITCQPCIEEMPSLLALSELVKDRDDVELIAVSTDAGWSEVRTLFPEDMEMTVLFDSDQSVTRDKFGTRLYPETWFVDPEGVIRLRIDGKRNWGTPLVLELLDVLRQT
jgi:peroxiredoxin